MSDQTCQRPVHPRVGGEHHRRCLHKVAVVGSSPRGRGTPFRKAVQTSRKRFIPAWAGNTLSIALLNALSTVHPRVGGEHSVLRVVPVPCTGSSPRGRGTLSSVTVQIRS